MVHHRDRLAALAFVLTITVTTVVTVRDLQSPRRPSPLWPPFTMTYTVLSWIPQSGELVADQTHRVEVASEYRWRDELLGDRFTPSHVGRVVEFRDGTMRVYDLQHRLSSTRDYGRGVVTNITPELNPTLLLNIQVGAYRDWQLLPSPDPERIVAVERVPLPCPSPVMSGWAPCLPGAGTGMSEYRIEFDARSVTPAYPGGIAVAGTRTVNGIAVWIFRAHALEMRRR